MEEVPVSLKRKRSHPSLTDDEVERMLQERERKGLTIQACASAGAEIARRKAAGIPRVFATRYDDEFDHLWQEDSHDAVFATDNGSDLEEGEIVETVSEKAASLMREWNVSMSLSNQTGTGLYQSNPPWRWSLDRGADFSLLHQRPPAPRGQGSILENVPLAYQHSVPNPSKYADNNITSEQAWENLPSSPLIYQPTEHKSHFTSKTTPPHKHLISPNEPSQLHTSAYTDSSNGRPRQPNDTCPQWKRWVRQCSENWDVQDTVPVHPYLSNYGAVTESSDVVGVQSGGTTTATNSTFAVSPCIDRKADDFLEELGQELLGLGKLPGCLLNG